MLNVQKGLNEDFESFTKGKLDGTELAKNNNARHYKSNFGYPAAWISFFCLIAGLATAICAYNQFIHQNEIKKLKKAEKENTVAEKTCVDAQKTEPTLTRHRNSKKQNGN